MTNYIEQRLKELMSEGTPPVRVSAAFLENDKWDDEGGADVSICIRHVMGVLRGPYYYLRDHGIMAPEIAFHINEPDLLTDGEHMGYQRCGDVVYYRGDNVDDILRDLAADVEDLARNTLRKHGDEAS